MNRTVLLLLIANMITTSLGHELAAADSKIVPQGAKLEALWEEGGFTEGVAAGPDGLLYFSDFAQPSLTGYYCCCRHQFSHQLLFLWWRREGNSDGLQ